MNTYVIYEFIDPWISSFPFHLLQLEVLMNNIIEINHRINEIETCELILFTGTDIIDFQRLRRILIL